MIIHPPLTTRILFLDIKTFRRQVFCCSCRWEGMLWQSFKKDFCVHPQKMVSGKINIIINKMKPRTKIRSNLRCNVSSLKTLKKWSKFLYIHNKGEKLHLLFQRGGKNINTKGYCCCHCFASVANLKKGHVTCNWGQCIHLFYLKPSGNVFVKTDCGSCTTCLNH